LAARSLKRKSTKTTTEVVWHDDSWRVLHGELKRGRGRPRSTEARHRANVQELRYFSFYVVLEKSHEREIETLLIRSSGPQLHFNSRKKRVDIQPGDIRDYEAGTTSTIGNTGMVARRRRGAAAAQHPDEPAGGFALLSRRGLSRAWVGTGAPRSPMTTRQEILQAIKRTAVADRALGQGGFSSATGIKEHQWRKH